MNLIEHGREGLFLPPVLLELGQTPLIAVEQATVDVVSREFIVGEHMDLTAAMPRTGGEPVSVYGVLK